MGTVIWHIIYLIIFIRIAWAIVQLVAVCVWEAIKAMLNEIVAIKDSF